MPETDRELLERLDGLYTPETKERFYNLASNSWSRLCELARKGVEAETDGNKLRDLDIANDQLITDLTVAEAQLATAQARIAELEADKERLDWLSEKERLNNAFSYACGTKFEVWRQIEPFPGERFRSSTLRLAIDAARQKEQGK